LIEDNDMLLVHVSGIVIQICFVEFIACYVSALLFTL